MGSDIKMEVSFRFLSLSHTQALELERKFRVADFGKHFKTGELTASLNLECIDLEALSSFLGETEIEVGATDIFISLVSEYDSRIVNVPSCVHEAIKTIGSKLVLSYTVV
jgi:hypothetical protein